MQSVAAQRPFFFDHIQELTEQAFDEFYALTGRRYEPRDDVPGRRRGLLDRWAGQHDPHRPKRSSTTCAKLAVSRSAWWTCSCSARSPRDLIGQIIQGKKGVAVLERLDQPLAVDLPLMREIRATVSKCLENGKDLKKPAYPELAAYKSLNDAPALYSGSFGMGSRDLQPEGIVGAVENMLADGPKKKLFYLSIDFLRDEAITPEAGDVSADHRRGVPQGQGAGGSRLRKPEPDAQGQHHRSVSLDRRLGRDHDGQEPGDDAVRSAWATT